MGAVNCRLPSVDADVGAALVGSTVSSPTAAVTQPIVPVDSASGSVVDVDPTPPLNTGSCSVPDSVIELTYIAPELALNEYGDPSGVPTAGTSEQAVSVVAGSGTGSAAASGALANTVTSSVYGPAPPVVTVSGSGGGGAECWPEWPLENLGAS